MCGGGGEYNAVVCDVFIYNNLHRKLIQVLKKDGLISNPINQRIHYNQAGRDKLIKKDAMTRTDAVTRKIIIIKGNATIERNAITRRNAINQERPYNQEWSNN